MVEKEMQLLESRRDRPLTGAGWRSCCSRNKLSGPLEERRGRVAAGAQPLLVRCRHRGGSQGVRVVTIDPREVAALNAVFAECC